MPIEKNVGLTLFERTDAILDFTIKDEAGNVPAGMASWDVRFAMKEKIDDANLIFDVIASIQDATNGKVRAVINGDTLTKSMVNAVAELVIWKSGGAVGPPDARIQFDATVRKKVR